MAYFKEIMGDFKDALNECLSLYEKNNKIVKTFGYFSTIVSATATFPLYLAKAVVLSPFKKE